MSRARIHAPLWVRITLLTALIVLLITAVLVVWVLPDFVDRHAAVQEPDDRAIPQTAKPPPPQEDQVRLALEKREAQRLLQQLLERQTVLEAQQVRVWGGADYEAVLQRIAVGDAELTNEDFAAAAITYRDATAMLAALEDSKAARLTAALEQGAQALQVYDAESAQKHFAIALAIDPQHTQARLGAARAETLERLARLLASGREHEQNREWVLAQEQYRTALRLDPESLAASEGVERVAATLKEIEFRTAMSEALTAIDNGALPEARRALERAHALNPGSAEVVDARQRLTRAIQAQKIAHYRRRAQRGADEERWRDVIADYEAVLAIDPKAQFAVQGLARAERLAELHAQLDVYLAAPNRLQSSEPRTNAAGLLKNTASLSAEGPRLRKKLDTLEDLVTLAGTPVEALIRSDNQTDVSIDRVGRIGRFAESRISLLPGTYRVRGTRVGYRDVRLEWTLRAGEAGQTIEVRCEERI